MGGNGTAATAGRAQRIGVVGVGYVGLVTAACLARLGHEVVCHDVDPERLRTLAAGRAPIHEPGIEELMAAVAGRLRFTGDAAEVFAPDVGVVMVCVDTPPLASGDADLSRIRAVIDGIPGDARCVLAMKSTVPAGTGARIRHELEARGLDGVAYVSNPEFLREGSAIEDFLRPDRIVVGGDDPDAVRLVAGLYAGLETEVVEADVTTAEMIKLASNAFLATKISFINEIANVCEHVGADVVQVARGMGLDRRIGSAFLRAGIGYGGSCFGKDVSSLKMLAGNDGYHFQLLTGVIEVNELQKRRVVHKLVHRLGSLHGRRIALLGLAFKPFTDDMREAASIVLSGRLIAEGALVAAYDPVAGPRARRVLDRAVDVVDTLEEAITDADAAVIVTEWPEFRDVLRPDLRDRMHHPILVDGRNLLDPAEAAAAGYDYAGIGRPDSVPASPPPGL